jgi:hypothetical protein
MRRFRRVRGGDLFGDGMTRRQQVWWLIGAVVVVAYLCVSGTLWLPAVS